VIHEFIGVKGYKAKGKRLSVYAVRKLGWLEPMAVDEPLQNIEQTEEEGPLPAVKFRFDAVEDAENVDMDDLPVSLDERPRLILLEDESSLQATPPGTNMEHKKRGRRKKQETSAEPTKEDEEPGDAIQMELPL
jgi:hypothetical protein